MTSPPRTKPIVSIGLPTYNREKLLRRAAAALVGQTYPALEICISDNASTDGTEAFCRELAAKDARVRYHRQPENRGATINYLTVQRMATGAYYMNMADDDVPDANYVEECVAALEADPSLAIVLGRPLVAEGDVVVKEGARTDLLDDDPCARVVRYYETVEENVAFLGVMRRAVLDRTPPSPNVMGGDWLYMAAVAFQGKIRTLDSTAIRKTAGGASRTTRQIAEFLKLPKIQGVLPIETILLAAFKDIAWKSPVYAELGSFGRRMLGTRVIRAISWRFHVQRVAKGVRRRLTGAPRENGSTPR